MDFIFDFLDVLSISFSTLITNSLWGVVIGLAISIIIIILLRKLYFKKVPKFIKKATGIFLGIFLFCGGLFIGTSIGIKLAINKSVKSFVFGTENAVFNQIYNLTGIDVWLPLDEYIAPAEKELEEEIRSFESNVTTSLETNYGNVYKTVCTLQKTVVPVIEIIDEAYKSNRKLINRFVDLDAFEQNAIVSNSIYLYNCVNSAAKKSYYNSNSENKNVDFIENLTGIKNSIDSLRNVSIGGVIDGFVGSLINKILNPFNYYINSYIYLYIFLFTLLVILCLIPLWIRLGKFKKGKLKVRLKSTKEKIIVTKDNLEDVLADLYAKNPMDDSKKNKVCKIISIILIVIICILSVWGSFIPCIFLFLANIPATIAKKKGRYFWIWYLYGMCFFLIAFIHSLVIKKQIPEKPYVLIEDKTNNEDQITIYENNDEEKTDEDCNKRIVDKKEDYNQEIQAASLS